MNTVELTNSKFKIVCSMKLITIPKISISMMIDYETNYPQ